MTHDPQNTLRGMGSMPPYQHQQRTDPYSTFNLFPQPAQQSSSGSRKRRASENEGMQSMPAMSGPAPGVFMEGRYSMPGSGDSTDPITGGSTRKKSRTNTPWTPAEEQRLKTMRDAGQSWSEIAKTFPARTEGSVKKHWYKDMHYAEFAEDESAALLAAIKEYEASKWKVIGQKVGKPAKACEQYAKEHFGMKS